MSSWIKYQRLVILVGFLLLASALPGLMDREAGIARSFTSIYGENIELLGYGAYANLSLLRASSYIGADWTMVLLVVPLLWLCAALMIRQPKWVLISGGGLIMAFYYAISLAFGADFNRYFLIYTVLFAVTGYTLAYFVQLTGKLKWHLQDATRISVWRPTVMLFVAGGTALVWLALIIPAQIQGDYSAFIDLNTTEPTFVLDLGVLFPLFTYCGWALLKQKSFGYRFTPALLTFYTLVGAMVTLQTLVQRQNGIVIPLPEMLGLVMSFIVLGSVSLVINLGFTKYQLVALGQQSEV